MACQTRLFSSSPLRASVIDSAKDSAKKVDRTIADAAVKGIEKGGMSLALKNAPPNFFLNSGTFRSLYALSDFRVLINAYRASNSKSQGYRRHEDG